MNNRLIAPLFNLALAIALGAFGAHALKNSLSKYQLDVYKTSHDYHMWVGIIWLILAVIPLNPKATKLTTIALPSGLLLFCGSLYGLAITNIRVLGAITPLGGATWIIALTWLSILALKSQLLTEPGTISP